MIKIILPIILYLLSPVLLLNFFKYIKQRLNRNKKVEKSHNPLEDLTYSQRVKRYKKFGFKEYSQKNKFIIIYILFIFIGFFISFINYTTGIIISLLLPFVFNYIARKMVEKELYEKDNLIDRLLAFKKSKMGLINPKSNVLSYEEEFEILENDEEDKKPTKIRLSLPVNFDPINADSFLQGLSIQFGRGRPFEIDYLDKEYPGWDTDKGKATIALQNPLPTMAKWDKHYIEDPIVQWSFFPLGIGSKGGIPIKNPETGEIENVIGIDVDGTQRKYCEKNNIFVGDDITASPMTLVAGVTGGGKSVAQWNIMNSCMARPKDWLLFGMDMKKVELSQLRQFGVVVGTTYKDCRDVACFVQKVMMDRYEKMEKIGINNWGDLPKDDTDYGSPAIMLICDEAGELLAPIAGKSDEAKEQQECQDQIRAAMESIARLGRAARVFLIAAAQRPSSDIIPMQIRQNMSNKLGCGTLPTTISGMLFENNEGARIKGTPKGRCAIKIHSTNVNHFQGFYSAGDKWLIEYIEEKGWPREIYGEDSINRNIESSSDSELEDEMSEDDFLLLQNAMN